MTPERWQRLKELFHAAVQQPPRARAAQLADACPDEEMRREAEALLDSHERAASAASEPAWAWVGEAEPARGTPRLGAGTRIGPYEVLEPLGAGGMGEVYRARDERLGRQVALKLLLPELALNPEHLRRFEEEARAASALSHPHILSVHDVGRWEGRPYLVSELLVGETAREQRQGALPTRKALGYATQAGGGAGRRP